MKKKKKNKKKKRVIWISDIKQQFTLRYDWIYKGVITNINIDINMKRSFYVQKST